MNRHFQSTAVRLLSLLATFSLIGCGNDQLDDNNVQSHAGSTIVVAPFRPTGNAESGQYALQLLEFSKTVESTFGAYSDWVVLESNRQELLTEELRVVEQPSASTANSDAVDQTPPAEVLAAYPEADFILLGQINGFDVAPERFSSTGLSRRVNRIRTSVDVQIVDVRSRQWLASRTVIVDERLDDNSAAETQVNQAMQLAAEQVVSAVLLATSSEFTVMDVEPGSAVARISGGAQSGVREGLQFRVNSDSVSARSAIIEITEAMPSSSIAKIVKGAVEVGDRVDTRAVEAQSNMAVAPVRISIGGFYDINAANKPSASSALGQQIQLQLKVNFQNYGGIDVMEDHVGIIKSAVNQQMLDDLAKGREPGLPLGSLRGVDYLVFGTMSYVGFKPASIQQQKMFGTTVTTRHDAVGKMDATIYMVDVNSGNYAISEKVVVDVPVAAGNESARVMGELSESFAQKMFAALMLKARPPAVIATQGDYAVFNHKQAIGYRVGDRFEATSAGQSVVDPATGVVLDGVGGATIGLLEIARFDASGWAHAKVVNGAMPEVGALLIKSSDNKSNHRADKKSRKLNW